MNDAREAGYRCEEWKDRDDRDGCPDYSPDFKAALRSERYDHVEQQLSGATLYAALREICAASRVDEAADRARRDADRNRRKKLALSKPTGSLTGGDPRLGDRLPSRVALAPASGQVASSPSSDALRW